MKQIGITNPIDMFNLPTNSQKQENLSSNQDQIQSYNEQYSQQQEISIPITKIQNLIKDIEFKKQKLFLIKIVGIFIIWTLVFLSLFYLLSLLIDFKTPIMGIVFTYVSIGILILLMRMGVRNKNRQPLKSCLILLGLLLFYTTLYFSFFLSVGELEPNKFSLDTIFVSIVVITITLNFFVNFIVLTYLLIERERIRFLYIIIIEVIFLIILCIVFPPTIIFIPLPFPYTYCLVKTFQQILIGKFDLKQNEVIPGAIAAFLGLFNTCNQVYRDL
ncbi:unnamed protein product [Paramecium sonneborni]|uniref:Transmembrane protein n=1 Tax=Paramecium sonneborni TaxID=65129 RepID=A0A8S1QS92_9CILI|nr:unnamed protein product [Paramecium sonneborni]